MTDATDTPSDFDAARRAVTDGQDPAVAAAGVVAAMTEEEKLGCLDGDAPFWAGLTYLGTGGYHKRPFYAARVERLGVPGLAFADGPRGVVVDRATCFPVSMARGATWDPELEERIGEVIGRELRAVGADLFGGVCVNVLRHPAWGRAQETYGEDPHLVGEMGVAFTRGVQRHAMACVKHFACNSMENARFSVDITVDEAALHEVYLPHFKAIVDAGVAVVMTAYNSVNGEWCGQNRELLAEVLRGEWGFDGFVISDWIYGLRDAGRSVAAGLDVEMPYRMIRARHLQAALDQGVCGWADVDAAVTRVVATRLRFADRLDRPASPRSILAGAEHRALAREAASRSVVLLRNQPVDGSPVLPLDPLAQRSVAVVGHLAGEVNLGDGGSSDVWVPDAVTVVDGLRAALPEASVTAPGDDLQEAATAAADADVTVVVVGFTFEDEGEYIGSANAAVNELLPGDDDPELAAAFNAAIEAEPAIEPPPHVAERPQGFSTGGDRTSLRLRDGDVELIGAVAEASPWVVVAVMAGSAVVVSEWVDAVPALVQSWYGGMEAGPGLADVLLGNVDASGRLPFSVPTEETHLPPFDRDAEAFTYDRWHGWWHLAREGHRPQFPFGFGLSYADLSLGEVEVEIDGGVIRVAATVGNGSDRSGAEVVQVYAHRNGSDGPERLVGFTRTEVDSGGEVRVRLDIPVDRLAERDVEAHRMVVVPGQYAVRVARHATDPGTESSVTVDGGGQAGRATPSKV